MKLLDGVMPKFEIPTIFQDLKLNAKICTTHEFVGLRTVGARPVVYTVSRMIIDQDCPRASFEPLSSGSKVVLRFGPAGRFQVLCQARAAPSTLLKDRDL